MNSLRLRLIVRRHGLPETRIVFTVSLDDDPTVSKLLEQVNDTIPLEADEWGLEDYVVELKSADGSVFECLHFQPIAGILEKDEEVFIRPLFSQDLKKRRLSGRHQISSNGKHLIDGVPFGRPLLKRPRDRPAIHISPRKRRRLTSGADDDKEPDDDEDDDTIQGGNRDQPLLLTQHGEGSLDSISPDLEDALAVRVGATFENVDDEDEDEDDADFGFWDADDEDISDMESIIDDDEIQDLHRENGQTESNEDAGASAAEPAVKNTLDLSTLDKITALRAAFPAADGADIEQVLVKCNNSPTKAYRKLAKRHEPSLDADAMLEFQLSLHAGPSSHAGEVSESEADEVNSVIQHYDQHGFPPGSLSNGTALAHMADALRKSHADISPAAGSESRSSSAPLRSDDATSDEDDTSSEGTSSESDSDQDSEADIESDLKESSSGSDSNSGSDSSPEQAMVRHTLASSQGVESDTSSSGSSSSEDDSSDDESSSDDAFDSDASSSGDSSDSSSSGSNSSSDSDSKPDEIPSKRPLEKTADSQRPDSESTKTLSADRGLQEQSAPGFSSSPTTHASAPKKGLPATQSRNARRRAALQARRAAAEARPDVPGSLDGASAGGAVTNPQLQARKQALLDVLAEAAGEDTQPTPKSLSGTGMGDTTEQTGASQLQTSQEKQGAEAPASAPQKRMRLDVGAGRRMLFGALGLRNPKTKADEDKLRADLMKDIRPVVNRRTSDSFGPQPDGTADNKAKSDQPVEDDDPEAWRDKITYRAVECCHDEIELSEPPFPFVQRWDPQQQGGYGRHKRGGRGKRKERQQAHYYDEAIPPVKKGRFEHEAMEDDSPGLLPQIQRAAEVGLNPDNEIVHEILDDLPSLPSDPSTLPVLGPGEAKAGMVITWKQWLLSKGTNWQPCLANVTALVVAVEQDGAALRVMLAKRDRSLDRSERVFDEATGMRVYDRFEAPDDDEDDENGGIDEGYRTIPLSELGDPHVVQQPLQPVLQSENDHASLRAVTNEAAANEQAHLAMSGASDSGRGEDTSGLGLGDSEKGRSSRHDQLDGPNTDDDVIPETYYGEDPGRSSTQPAQAASHPDVAIFDLCCPDADMLIGDAGSCQRPLVSNEKDGSHDPSSPTQQLEQMAEAVALASQQASREPSHQLGLQVTRSAEAALDDAAAANLVRAETPRVKYPRLHVLSSSASSVGSGRQPDPGFGISDGHDMSFGGLEGATEGSGQTLSNPKPNHVAQTPEKEAPAVVSSPSSACPSSSLPSISEIWHTAGTSRSIRGPSRSATLSALKSRKPEIKRDLDYEEAMQRLGQGGVDSDEESPAALMKKARPL